jgi:hypothetical protein
MNSDDAARSAFHNIETAMLRAVLGTAMVLIIAVFGFAVYRLCLTCCGACAAGFGWVVIAALSACVFIALIPLTARNFEIEDIVARAAIVGYRAFVLSIEIAANATRA